MQTVFNNDMVSHVWAQQSQPIGRNGNKSFFFQGATIYSYGTHFPIARFADAQTVLFTTSDYSVTTSAHKSLVWRALSGSVRVYEVADPLANDKDAHLANVADMVERANEFVRRAAKRRKAEFVGADLANTNEIVRDARDYVAHFKLSAKRLLNKLPETANVDLAGIRQRLAEIERKEKETRRRKLAQDARKWLSGELYSLRGYPDVLLRVSRDGNEIETSQGARVPFDHAVTMWRALSRGKDIIGARVGFFRVDRVTANAVHIGCHTVPRAAMDNLAKSLGIKA